MQTASGLIPKIMRDILNDIEKWIDTGETIALATVIQTWGSSPRKVGSHMAFTLSGKITGSVSGGCVENAVIEAGYQVLKTNQPQLLHFGVADETAWEVGLACGGSIDIFVNVLNQEVFHHLKSIYSNETSAIHVTMIAGSDKLLGKEIIITEDKKVFGSLGNEWDEQVLNLAMESLSSRRVMLNEDVEVFIFMIQPSPTLIIVGGVHIAIALVSLAKTLGYQTILIDPRKAWGNVERFPDVDSIIQAWVDEAFAKININSSAAIAVLTHDPKIDDPAIKLALNSSAFYVGALGSKTTNAKRNQRLLADGVSESQINKIHAPIGLDIGAQNPEEIALAIMSEIVKSFRKQNQVEVKNEAKSLTSSLLS
ncbi:MAG: XdhC family protein [Anaerolineales bacterium]|nr:XdhC family protein [Anaerolineales bacterium]